MPFTWESAKERAPTVALFALAVLVAFLVTVIVMVLARPDWFWQGAACGSVFANDLGLVVPGEKYFLSVPAGGTAVGVKPCDDTTLPQCLRGLFVQFKPALTSKAYTSPYIAVRLERQDATDRSPLRPGEPVGVFFEQQGVWFTGKDKMVSPSRADALFLPLTRPAAGVVPDYTAPTGDLLTTSELLFAGTDQTNLRNHNILVGSTAPLRIGRFVSGSADS